MKASDLAKRVKRQFGDESGVQVTDEDILMWVSDGVREAITQNNSVNIKTRYVPMIAKKSSYTFSGLSYSAIHAIKSRTTSSDAYVELNYLAPREFEENFVDRDFGPKPAPVAGASPMYYSSDGSNGFKVFPVPGVSDGQGFSITYNSYMCDVESLEDELPLSERYFQYLLEYCLMKAYELDENWEAADRKAMFIQSTLNVLHSGDLDQNATKYPVISNVPGDF